MAGLLAATGCAGITETQGKLETGERWDVRIGMPAAESRGALERHGFTYLETTGEGRCLGPALKPGEKADVYEMQKWRRGTACVIYRDNAVVRLEWFASMFLP